MTTPIAPGRSRVALLKQFTIVALDVLPQSTKIGAWAFSTDLVGKQAWKDMSGGIDSIERTPVDNAHRAELVAAANSLPGLVAKNGDTGLYDSA